MKEQGRPMSRQEIAVKDFLRGCLAIQSEEQVITHILTELGKYYDADRSYIFEADEETAHTVVSCHWGFNPFFIHFWFREPRGSTSAEV